MDITPKYIKWFMILYIKIVFRLIIIKQDQYLNINVLPLLSLCIHRHLLPHRNSLGEHIRRLLKLYDLRTFQFSFEDLQ